MSASVDTLLIEIGKVIFTTIVATAISLYAQKRFVEKNQKKSQHSKDIAMESLGVLAQRIRDICQEGCEYNFENDRLVPKKLHPYTSIPYYNYVKEHFLTGYAEEWKLWLSIEDISREYNTKYAEISEKIRQDLFKEYPSFKEKEYYHKIGHFDPPTFLKPDYIANTIIEELLNRLKGFKEWFPGSLEQSYFESGGKRIFTVKTTNGPHLSQSNNQDKSQAISLFITRKVTNVELVKEVAVLQKLKEQKESYFTLLSDRIAEIKSSIELGDLIKGKCDVCSHF